MNNDSTTIKNDIKTLTKTELREKYKLTAYSHDNMKKRVKTEGAIIHQDLNTFADFLLNVGERKTKDYTLDRIDNNDPEYAPNKVRWVDKTTQNNNRSNNVTLTYDGETLTIAQWAHKTNQNANTLYKRHKRGWSDEETIRGYEMNTNWIQKHPFPFKYASTWLQLYNEYIVAGGEGRALSKIEFLYMEAKVFLQDKESSLDAINMIIGERNNISISNDPHDHISNCQKII